jgi:FAD/FMN-containing dehydrogenase
MNEITTNGMPAAARALRARLTGEYVVPGDEGWNEARQAWNLAVDQRPAAVALPESAEDVVEIVRFARENGLRVAPQGTGHNASPLGPLEDTVLVKTSRMRSVEIDPEARVARVEAGVIWIEAVKAAAEHGLATLAGSSPDVGVVGYTLGGGMSWLARRYGLAANSVTAVELVTADGRLVRADAENETELFWALRGGGGSFGVVTALEFRLYPIAEVYAGVLFFPIERAREVLHAWREWVEDVPVEMTSVGRLLQLPPIPDIPEPLRGRSFVVVETIYLGDEADGAALIRPLRELGHEIDTVRTIPISELSRLHMDPDHPVPGRGDGMLLADAPHEAIDRMVSASVGSPLLSVELRHLGGAVAEEPPGHGAVAKLDAAFAMFALGAAPTPQAAEAVGAAAAAVRDALTPWDAGRMNLNFAQKATTGRRLFGEPVYRRLREIKARVDPDDVFRSNHPIPPARESRRRAASRRSARRPVATR